MKPLEQEIIKSRERVRNHGEVLTPKRVVKKMLDMPGLKEACENLEATFFEPGVGEGAFLTEVLRRKLKMVSQQHGSSLIAYENHSLLALSTLYGVELLEDNTKTCVVKMYETYLEAYGRYMEKMGRKTKQHVLDCATFIIVRNIVQGDFLAQLSPSGQPIIFNEWKWINRGKGHKKVIIKRTEHTLRKILSDARQSNKMSSSQMGSGEQLQFFTPLVTVMTEAIPIRYKKVKITDVYKEEVEIDESNSD